MVPDWTEEKLGCAIHRLGRRARSRIDDGPLRDERRNAYARRPSLQASGMSLFARTRVSRVTITMRS
ncbi:hypothetical protein OK074_2301 [Actinobacteria bacterium OK074]|nr:hypothetical protein OK074_2301 [Actinobacteria bacterium OK074]